MPTRFGNGFFWGLLKLGAKHVAHGVTDLEHAANPRGSPRRERERLKLIAATNYDLPVAISQPTFFDCSNSRNLVFTRRISGSRPLSNRVNRRRQTRDGFIKNFPVH